MTSPYATRRWERWGTGRGRVFGRVLGSYAVARLARQLQRDTGSLAAGSLVRIAAKASQPVAGQAFDALVAVCEEPRAAGEVVYQSLLQCGGGRDAGDDRAWTAVAGPLLLGGGPPPRLVRFLDGEPAGDHEWTRPEGIAERLMMLLSDSPRRPDLVRFLSATDQPLILAALAARWDDGGFLPGASVAQVSTANPHLDPATPPGRAGGVLLAVAKDRPDLIDLTRPGTVDAVLNGTRLASAELAEKYRRVLRELPEGGARERLCEIACSRMPGYEEAVAAAIDAGYAPEGQRERAVFYFLTEQWEKYDAVDPDGELVYAAYLDVHRSPDLHAHSRTWQFIDTARRNGRPDPAARYLRENPIPRRPQRDRPRGSGGGHSSDYGSGGDYGSGWTGDSGGGWTGGSFHT
ncbi:hypothetical protein ACIGAN_04425 [Streptomyces sp. NPDC085931]|uniref:hypothetical protein n=1 Tax=Streptomyces sp. NPDC085931 TaxID=3365740 RepID=UPI0037D6A0A3